MEQDVQVFLETMKIIGDNGQVTMTTTKEVVDLSPAVGRRAV
jgi:hypothetical protein